MGRWLLIVIGIAAIYKQLRVCFVCGATHHAENESVTNSRLRGSEFDTDTTETQLKFNELGFETDHLAHNIAPLMEAFGGLVKTLKDDAIDKDMRIDKINEFIDSEFVAYLTAQVTEALGDLKSLKDDGIDKDMRIHKINEFSDSGLLKGEELERLMENLDINNSTSTSGDSAAPPFDPKLDALVNFLHEDDISDHLMGVKIAEYIIGGDMHTLDQVKIDKLELALVGFETDHVAHITAQVIEALGDLKSLKDDGIDKDMRIHKINEFSDSGLLKGEELERPMETLYINTSISTSGDSAAPPFDPKLDALVNFLNEDDISEDLMALKIAAYVTGGDMLTLDQVKIDRLKLGLVGSDKLEKLRLYLFGPDVESSWSDFSPTRYLSKDDLDLCNQGRVYDDLTPTTSAAKGKWDEWLNGLDVVVESAVSYTVLLIRIPNKTGEAPVLSTMDVLSFVKDYLMNLLQSVLSKIQNTKDAKVDGMNITSAFNIYDVRKLWGDKIFVELKRNALSFLSLFFVLVKLDTMSTEIVELFPDELGYKTAELEECLKQRINRTLYQKDYTSTLSKRHFIERRKYYTSTKRNSTYINPGQAST